MRQNEPEKTMEELLAQSRVPMMTKKAFELKIKELKRRKKMHNLNVKRMGMKAIKNIISTDKNPFQNFFSNFAAELTRKYREPQLQQKNTEMDKRVMSSIRDENNKELYFVDFVKKNKVDIISPEELYHQKKLEQRKIALRRSIKSKFRRAFIKVTKKNKAIYLADRKKMKMETQEALLKLLGEKDKIEKTQIEWIKAIHFVLSMRKIYIITRYLGISRLRGLNGLVHFRNFFAHKMKNQLEKNGNFEQRRIQEARL